MVVCAAGEGPFARLLYVGAIASCAVLLGAHGVDLVRNLGGGAGFAALAGLLLGAAAADFATGVVHWACDSYGDERTPAVGRLLIRSFREHHRHPRAMLAHDAIEVNGLPAVVVLLGLGVLALPGARDALHGSPFVHAFALALLAVSALGNQLHRWAHTAAAPRIVRGLQRRGWILSPHGHARHHRPPHASTYCTATGWCNAPLDAVGLWRGLERAVERATGAAPRTAPPGTHRDSR